MNWYHALKVKGRTCHGLTLWRGRRTLIELWVCPTNFSVGEHTHEKFDGHITLLVGQVVLCKRVEGAERSTRRMFKSHSIPAGTPHWFRPSTPRAWLPTVFINVERWRTEPTSAAVDFHPVAS